MTMKEADTLIIGFGFSAIPLLRELELTGHDYTIISEKSGSVWAELERSDKLDFDLVSSYFTSFYTFDLVKDFSEDRYPTAREFYDMHLRYYEQYKDQIIDDFVTLVEDKGDYNLVHTRNGDCYRAKNVVISTAFKRQVHDSLNNFDFSIRNKTVVMNTIGDSANLMIAKLVTGDNKVILLQNGFLALDKIFQMGNTTYSLDQLEAHQISEHFKPLYNTVIDLNFVKLFKIFPKNKFGAAYMSLVRNVQDFLGKIFTPNNFHVPFESARRGYEVDRKIEASIPNGIVVVKYWPIDQYAREFSDNLPESIKDGFLLNDIIYFISEGFVNLMRKDQTTIDKEHQTIQCDGETIHYDYLIEGDAEVPRLPRITYEKDGKTHDFEYVYREGYLGSIQKDLNNIYLLGYTRPVTGGLSTITEMQSMLIHKMITNRDYYANMRQHLDEKIDHYNKKYYPSIEPGTHDHLVFAGFYTEEVAKEVGVNITPKSCKSLWDLAKYFTYPNNPDKYRQSGEYKIENADKFVDHVFKLHKGFKLIWQMILCFITYQALFVGIDISLYMHDMINGYVFTGALVFQYFFGYWMMILVANTTPFFGTKLLLHAVYFAMLFNPVTALAILPLDFAITYFMRKHPKSRYPFNDLKNKKRYHAFYQRYKEVYNKVNRSSSASTKKTDAKEGLLEQAS